MTDIDKDLQGILERCSPQDRAVLTRALEHREFLKIAIRDARESIAGIDEELRDMENSMTKFDPPTE